MLYTGIPPAEFPPPKRCSDTGIPPGIPPAEKML